MFQGFFTKKFLDDFATTTFSFMNGYKIYVYWDNIQGFPEVLRTWGALQNLMGRGGRLQSIHGRT